MKSKSSRRRRWLAIGGALLLLCLGLLLGYPTWFLVDGSKDQDAVGRLTQMGAIVERKPLDPIVSSILFEPPILCYGRVWWVSLRAADDAALKPLENLNELEELNLSNSAISDEGLKSLGRLGKLRALYLTTTPITDEGLAHLDKLEHLERLSLSGTNVTDEGLQHLVKLKRLRVLYIKSTSITQDGKARLQSEMPSLYIHY